MHMSLLSSSGPPPTEIQGIFQLSAPLLRAPFFCVFNVQGSATIISTENEWRPKHFIYPVRINALGKVMNPLLPAFPPIVC